MAWLPEAEAERGGHWGRDRRKEDRERGRAFLVLVTLVMASSSSTVEADAAGAGANSMRRPHAGQLSKFTNVVKGWQPRWFVLDPESGRLEYFLPKSEGGLGDKLTSHHSSSGSAFAHGPGKSRGAQHLAGAVVLPSDEDSQTFNVNFASGESFKLRGANARERQLWVDRVRAVVQLHDAAIAQNNPPLSHAAASILRHHEQTMPPTPPGAR